MRLRAEETVEIDAFCMDCEWEGPAEVVEGEFAYGCPQCHGGGLIRGV